VEEEDIASNQLHGGRKYLTTRYNSHASKTPQNLTRAFACEACAWQVLFFNNFKIIVKTNLSPYPFNYSEKTQMKIQKVAPKKLN